MYYQRLMGSIDQYAPIFWLEMALKLYVNRLNPLNAVTINGKQLQTHACQCVKDRYPGYEKGIKDYSNI